MRLKPSNRLGIVCALGISQTIAWASSYYLPAVLTMPIARDLGISPIWVSAAFSFAMICSAIAGPWAGNRIDILGGRTMLVSANFIFIAGLCLLGLSTGRVSLFAAWLLLGLGMGIGLYDSAFATLVAVYAREARASIAGITIIAGLSSTLGWPLSSLLEAQYGWRAACFTWAGLHVFLALPLNALLPSGTPVKIARDAGKKVNPPEQGPQLLQTLLLAFIFSVTLFSATAMAVHLPRLLEVMGATSTAAVAAGALLGPAQALARIFELTLLQRLNPLKSTLLALLAHPIGALILACAGGPAAAVFTILHGAGNGILTIAKGTLPLSIFGPEGYGLKQGIISLPARILQAFSPLLFGFALEFYGKNALWLTFAFSLSAFAALLLLRHTQKQKDHAR